MFELDRLAWLCLFIIARWTVGACAMFCGIWVGPRWGLPVFARSSACTSIPTAAIRWLHELSRLVSIPFSSRILSSKEFLYRNIKHSSAALRWAVCRLCRLVSCTRMVSSSCLIYSVLRSLKAAWAWRFLCLRSSDVAYI